jgi:hypothetical protein
VHPPNFVSAPRKILRKLRMTPFVKVQALELRSALAIHFN